MKSFLSKSFIFLNIILMMSGCGYQQLRSQTFKRLEGVKTIAIPVFMNRTTEVNVDKIMTQALVDEFIKRNRLELVSKDEADAVIEGEVTAVNITPISYKLRSNDTPLAAEYLASLKVKIQLRRRSDGAIFLKLPVLEDHKQYSAGGSILLRESVQQATFRRIAQDLMTEVYDRLIEAW